MKFERDVQLPALKMETLQLYYIIVRRMLQMVILIIAAKDRGFDCRENADFSPVPESGWVYMTSLFFCI